MKQRLLYLSDAIETYAAMEQYCGQAHAANSHRIKQMKKLLSAAMKLELTEKQKICLIRYYLENQKVPDIAAQLHIRPTTVYKHLKKARLSLSKCAIYMNVLQ